MCIAGRIKFKTVPFFQQINLKQFHFSNGYKSSLDISDDLAGIKQSADHWSTKKTIILLFGIELCMHACLSLYCGFEFCSYTL